LFQDADDILSLAPAVGKLRNLLAIVVRSNWT